MKRIILLCLAIVFALSMLAAEYSTLYVQSLRASVVSEPRMSARRVMLVERGQQLQVIKQEGHWYNVTVDGQTGWISALLVSPTEPMKTVTPQSGYSTDISQNSRRRASRVTVTAAVRGLAEDERRRLGSESRADFASLEKIEAIEISDEELDRFISELK